ALPSTCRGDIRPWQVLPLSHPLAAVRVEGSPFEVFHTCGLLCLPQESPEVAFSPWACSRQLRCGEKVRLADDGVDPKGVLERLSRPRREWDPHLDPPLIRFSAFQD